MGEIGSIYLRLVQELKRHGLRPRKGAFVCWMDARCSEWLKYGQSLKRRKGSGGSDGVSVGRKQLGTNDGE